MSGVITVRSRITAATQFSAAAPTVTFQEAAPLNGLPPSWTARILGYSFVTTGTAPTLRISLRPPANTVPNLDDEIVLVNTTTANVYEICGGDGLEVPRQYGFAGENQQPVTTQITSGETYQMFVSTVGKDAAATLFVWYRIAQRGA